MQSARKKGHSLMSANVLIDMERSENILLVYIDSTQGVAKELVFLWIRN